MSPVELRMNRVSLQTQWWTAACLLLSVSWTLQQDNIWSSSSTCRHRSCSSQSPFSSTQQRPAANDNRRSDCSSHTPENRDFSRLSVYGCSVRSLRLDQSLPVMMGNRSWYSLWSCSLTVCSSWSAGHSETQSRETEADRPASTSSSLRSHWDPTARSLELLTPGLWTVTSSQQKLETEENITTLNQTAQKVFLCCIDADRLDQAHFWDGIIRKRCKL